MKVVFVSAVKGMSGAEIFLARLIRSNPSLDPVVIAPRGPLQAQLERDDVKVVVSRGLSQLRRRRNPLWPVLFLVRWLISTIEIFRICRKERPDIIQSAHFAAALYVFLPAKMLGIPHVWHIHDIIPPGSLEGRVCRILGSSVDQVVAVSWAVQESLVGHGVPSKKIRVIHNGVDSIHEFNPDNQHRGVLRKSYGLNERVFRVGLIGLITPPKGQHLFLEAVERICSELTRPVRFFVIGDSWSHPDAYKQQLLDKVSHAHLDDIVYFTGRRSDIAAVLADLDIVVLASTVDEAQGLVVLEAMAMGKLVIASRVGGVPEMIHDGSNGFLFPPGDVQALAGLLTNCIHQFETLTDVGRNARTFAQQQFSIADQNETFVELYNTLQRREDRLKAAPEPQRDRSTP